MWVPTALMFGVFLLGGKSLVDILWCMVVLWVSCPELLGVESLQPVLPRSAAGCSSPVSRGAETLHSCSLPCWGGESQGWPRVSLQHLGFGAGHGGAGACHLCLQHISGAVSSQAWAGLAPGGPATTSLPLHVLGTLPWGEWWNRDWEPWPGPRGAAIQAPGRELLAQPMLSP